MRAADTHPFDYPTVAAVAHMGQLLDDRSGGRLRIRSYPGGQLGEEKDTLEITIFGGLDINRVNLAPLNPIAPETIVPNLPFLFRSTEHMHRAMDGPPGQRILASLEPHGLVGLCFYDSGARSFYSTRRPIRTPEDLRGLKIRVQNSDVFVAMVEALGADATPMSYGEVYQSLIQGVVSGAENNWPAYEDSRHHEAAKFYSLTRHVMAPEVLVVSARTWNKLPEPDRALLRAAARESVPVMRKLWERREAEARALLAREGVQVNEITDRRAFEHAVQPVWEQFVRTPEQRAIVNQIRALA
ncbi:MAG TPA: TRAP transporter substrate-binding protein [Sphingomonadaceae bacterium]|nr:TRAP transporter substrate-binding protein [Sphingomonadaceae bacterium]